MNSIPWIGMAPQPVTEQIPSPIPSIRNLVIKQPIGKFNRSSPDVDSPDVP